MVTVGSDLKIVKLFWNKKTYQIKVEKAKLTDKQDIEKTYSTDSHKPNKITFGKMEFSLDLSGCQSHRSLFVQIRERQEKANFANVGLPNITTYKYENGKLKTDYSLRGCFVEEISEEEAGKYDVKLDVMNRAYRDAKNKIY